MKNCSGYTGIKKTVKVFSTFVFLFLLNLSVHSQSIVNHSTVGLSGEISTNNLKQQESTRISSNMDFVLWFMGSKQDPNILKSSDQNNIKKHIMSSGLAPNRLLMRAFLKKVVGSENA